MSNRRRKPPHGMPRAVVLVATPDGWRHTVLTSEGGMLCGRLAGVPAGADPRDARAAAAAVVVGLARDLHSAEVEVAWEASGDPRSWTGRVVPAATGGASAPVDA
ncbi:hypothetical protein ACQI4E_28385 [Streptomyces sp. CA-252508]|uniref:hypothetical protein n=1 Tax=Streptomyces sp. CA-252508 TaxID=3418946 RepID=UPI003D93C1EB